MGDLISRKWMIKELLKERDHYPPMVEERYSFGVKVPHSFNMAMRGGIRKGLRLAETAPAVDAEPVRRGEWIERGCYDEDGYYSTYFVCSECGREEPYKEAYCHCGAKMKEEMKE